MKSHHLTIVCFFTCLAGLRSYGEVATFQDNISPENLKVDGPGCFPQIKSDKSYPLPPGSKQPTRIAFSPDGAYLATANKLSKDITVYQVGATGQLTGHSHQMPFPNEEPVSLAFSPDGKYLAVVIDGYRLIIYTIGTLGAPLNPVDYPLPMRSGGHWSVAFSPTDPYLAVSCREGFLDPWDGGQSTNYAVVIYTIGENCSLIDPTVYPVFGGSYAEVPIAFSPNGNYLAVGNYVGGSGSEIALCTISAGGVLNIQHTYTLPQDGLSTLAFSPNGLYFAFSNSYHNFITLYKFDSVTGVLSNPTTRNLPNNSKTPNSITFSPNSKYIATANFESHDRTIFGIKLSGLLENGVDHDLPIGSLNPFSVAFSPDGIYLASGNHISRDVSMLKIPICIPIGPLGTTLNGIKDDAVEDAIKDGQNELPL